VVELRHVFGLIFDCEKKSIGFEEELKLIQSVFEHVKQDVPHFELTLIVAGIK
jgi:hypothetical protein